MSIPVSAYSIIARASSIGARFPGGMTAFETFCPNRTFCTDGQLARVTFMTSRDANAFIAALRTRGLRSATDGEADMVMVAENSTSPVPDWLDLGQVDGRPAAWLAGQPPGPLAETELPRASEPLTHMSVEEFQRAFEYVGTGNHVDTYRNRETGQLVYVGRVAGPATTAAMKSFQVARHDRMLRWARRLVRDELPLHEQQGLPLPGPLARAKLTIARGLLSRVIALNPTNGLAMFITGMIDRRFQMNEAALAWFQRSSEVNPYEPNALREACRCALELGRGNAALQLARRATELNPADPGLRANLAIALLLANRAHDAQAEIDRALSAAPNDPISLNIRALVKHFRTTGETPPDTLGQLEGFQQSRRAVASRGTKE